jgi:nicotinamidase/pyrazinamidase
MNALILVDIQNDFCPGGALAVNDGDSIVPVANEIMRKFFDRNDLVVATQDWHPADHGSFAANNNTQPFTMGTLGGQPQMMWPAHCVQNTPGAELHPDLLTPPVVFYKGCDPTVDSYSGFQDNHNKNDTGLLTFLLNAGVKKVYICGLATDYCVKFTALDAVKHFETYVVVDACRGVNYPVGSENEAIIEMTKAGIKIINSDEV